MKHPLYIYIYRIQCSSYYDTYVEEILCMYICIHSRKLENLENNIC